MALRGSETTEAISQGLEYMKMATPPLVALKGKSRVTARSCLILLISWLLLGCTDTGNRISLYFEETDIRKAAECYLDAEVQRDLKTAFNCLAPSSAYRAAHTYEDYLRETSASPVRITGYRILEISKLRDNHDRNQYPRIDQFVQVEVDVTFSGKDLKESVPVNYSFTFIKEEGKWYKG
jgi:hypothetical protein